MMPTKDEFFTSFSKENQRGPTVEIARVGAFAANGEPLLIFPPGDSISQKIYPRMKHYIPALHDRVMLIEGVIIGGWRGSA